MKTSILVLSLLLCLAIVTSSYSQKRSASSHSKRSYCASAESRRAMDECQIKIHDKAEAVMNRAYNKFMLSLDEAHKTNLKQAQQAWEKYRDSNCDLASDLMYQTCMIEMTEKRTIELQEFFKHFLE